MSRRISGFVFVTALLAGGCSSSTTSPAPAPNAPVRVTVSQSPTFAAGMAVFSVRLDNVSGSPVNLTFPSSCKLLPYFSDRSGRAVTPAGGGFACLTVITQLTLSPGVAYFESFTVKPGTSPDGQFIVLPAGEYRIRGRLEDNLYKLESDPLAFTLQ